MSRARYIGRQAARSAVTLFVVVTFNFWLFRILPGSYTQLITRAGSLDPAATKALKRSFGLDHSLIDQYFIYLKHLVTFNWGVSFVSREPVASIVGDALLNTLILITPAFFLMVFLGIGLGVIAGSKRDSHTDTSIVTASLALWSLPTFWFGLMLILLFSGTIGVLPVAGLQTYGATYATPFDKMYDVGLHLLLPTITLALGSIAQFVLIMRNSLGEVLDEDYMTTARAKGLGRRRIIWGHGVPNAFLPTFTLTALNLGILLSTTIQVETVFSWPGIGLLIYTSVTERDYPVLEASFLVIGVVVIFANFVADIVYSRLDPRITDESQLPPPTSMRPRARAAPWGELVRSRETSCARITAKRERSAWSSSW